MALAEARAKTPTWLGIVLQTRKSNSVKRVILPIAARIGRDPVQIREHFMRGLGLRAAALQTRSTPMRAKMTFFCENALLRET
jgi:hypothetical protein